MEHDIEAAVEAVLTNNDWSAIKRNHLHDSCRMRFDGILVGEGASGLLEGLMQELEASEGSRSRARNKDNRERLKQTLGRFVAALWELNASSSTTWLAYSRAKDAGLKDERYVSAHIRHTTITAAADFLVKQGYADHCRGSYQRADFNKGTRGFGYLSRLRATSKLTDLIVTLGLRLQDCVRRNQVEPIVMRERSTDGQRWVSCDYEDSEESNKLRNTLLQYLAMMEEHSVLNPMAEDTKEGANWKTRLYRVFNGSWDMGGRFYGGWWQHIPKKRRNDITINGEATVELDYGSLHPRLCYQLAGKPLPIDIDPYDIEGVDKVYRGVVKVIFMQLLNMKSGGAPSLPDQFVGMIDLATYRDIVRKVEAHHRPISGWFRQGPRSLELQAIDARIADAVLGYFTAFGCPILPVHDSFIVTESKESMLRQCMLAAYDFILRGLKVPVMEPVIRREG